MGFGKKVLVSPWLYCLVRFGLAAVFIWAGLVKLTDPKSFAEIISAYELVPRNWLVPVAIGVPALEVVAGLGLIIDVRGSLGVTFGLLVMFVLVLWFGILKDLDVDCGCFSLGELEEYGSLRAAMYRDLAMIAAVAYLVWWRRWSPDGLPTKQRVRNIGHPCYLDQPDL